MDNRHSKRHSGRKNFFKKKSFIFLVGIIIGFAVFIGMYQTSVYFSTDESCMICHVHPHVEDSWRQSVHMNNKSGTKTSCVACHLPPQTNTWKHYTAKAKLGIKDVWSYMFKDSASYDWENKSQLENAIKYIPNESCVACHYNLFPQGITDDGITVHLYYEENVEKLDLQCISCHLNVGHYNPNYSHAKMTGIPGLNIGAADNRPVFETATEVTSFADYTEQIPGTPVSFNMVAIPGGTFRMGSTPKEPFHKADEAPVRNVTLSPFFMAEVEVTWEQYWAFYANTMSEGRTHPDEVYRRNADPSVDGVSGPTPPFGFPDQGWGAGDRPAITMTHYAAETFCQWLSLKTGKTYRLPTEAEWEYAARGGTETPYFFEGSPKKYSKDGFWRRFIDPSTDVISDYVIYAGNSRNKTQEPSAVQANPFGLKNMAGNVMEYCADKYDPEAYNKTPENVTDPLVTTGTEWVVRGGNYTSDAADLRSAARGQTQHDAWLKTDPQQPKSIWWYSDIRGIGFRVVCEPDASINVY